VNSKYNSNLMRGPTFFGWALLLTSSVAAQEPTIEARAERCEIALAYADALLDQLHGKVVFIREGEQAYSRLSKRKWFLEDGSPAVSPPRPLLRSANRRGRVDALSLCPSMAAELNKIVRGRRIVVSRSTIEVDAVDGHAGEQVRVGITLPVISRRKDCAIIFSSQVSGPVAGGIYAYYMTRTSEKGWVVVSSKSLAVA
jgi:hypothetical protein